MEHLFFAKGRFNLRTTPSYAGILNNDQNIGKDTIVKRAMSQTINYHIRFYIYMYIMVLKTESPVFIFLQYKPLAAKLLNYMYKV